MVSRHTPSPAPFRLSPRNMFDAWRRLLGRSIRLVSVPLGAGRPPGHAGQGAAVHASAGDPPSAALPLAGIALAVLGTAAGMATGGLGGASTVSGGLFAVQTCLWAAFRLIALRLVSSSRRGGVARAWAAGLAPYCIGVTPPLRAVAFAASALLTHRLLAASSVDRQDSRRAVAVVFGIQALATLLSWIVVDGLAFLPSVAR